MQIEQLISHLQAIAAKYPNSIVYVEDGMDPSDSYPITNIEHNRGCPTGPAKIYLSSGFYDEQPFDIDELTEVLYTIAEEVCGKLPQNLRPIP